MNNNSSRPSISVITICRNSAGTIARTIESVLGQQVEGRVEYIIVDGASSDGTQEIVRGYGEGITTFVSEPDSGIADAFNKGIRLATGEVVAIINSDDQLQSGALKRVESYFSEHPGIDVIHGDILLYEKGRLLKRIRPPKYWWLPWRLIVINHPATFVRRRVYESCGLFDTTFRYAMDIDIYLRWRNGGHQISYIPEAFARMEAGGVGGQNACAAFAENRRAMIKNGHSPILAWLQYLSRFGVQFIVECQKRWRTLSSTPGSGGTSGGEAGGASGADGADGADGGSGCCGGGKN